MAQLSETFPTLDCSQCILTPRMVEVAQHPNITLITYSELESLDGFIGNFKANIRKRARKPRREALHRLRAVPPKMPDQEDPRRDSTRAWECAGPSTCRSRRRCPTSR